MPGYVINLREVVQNNPHFRKVLFTAVNLQLVVMDLKPNESIGPEVHHLDQFFYFESGIGKITIDSQESHIGVGDVAFVPAGSNHLVVNASDTQSLKFSTLYAPPEHPDGTLHHTAADANAAHTN